MKTLFVLLLLSHSGSTERFTLKYLTAGSSGLHDFPEFIGAAMIDEVLFGHCDSNTGTAKPTQDWSTELVKDDPELLEHYTQNCLALSHIYRNNIHFLKKVLNQSEGVHIFQHSEGCEWDDESGETDVFFHFGYDGEDLITLDLKTLTWIVPKLHVSPSTLGFQTDKTVLQRETKVFLSICTSFLEKYLHYGRSFLQRTVLPSVSLLQKSPSSPVTCHATGFYPDRAVMFWRRDGEELQEDVDHGEILPNHDGSFQMSVDLLKPPPEDWWRYECVFQLHGLKEDIITKLEKAAIRSNKGSEFPTGPVTGVIVGLLLLSVCITGLFIWRKKNNGFQLTNREQEASEEEAELH